MSHRIEFSPEALADLIDLYDYIAMRDGAEPAIGYIDRVEDCCRSLSVFPNRGIRRDDLRPGLRILGFERRAAIALHVTADTVTILRILYGGRDIETAFPSLGSQRLLDGMGKGRPGREPESFSSRDNVKA